MITGSNPFPRSDDPSSHNAGVSASQDRDAASIDEESKRLAERMTQGAHAAIDRAAERVAPAVDRWGAQLMRTGDRLHEQVQRLEALQAQWADNCRGTVRQHPLTVVAGALVFGMLVGRLTAR
jgi:ElaB/YqjD/DUF883 family membrane-anchored ribosome-binding protein